MKLTERCHDGLRAEPQGRLEVRPFLLAPTIATAALSLGTGVASGLDLSPLGWAKLIAAREFAE